MSVEQKTNASFIKPRSKILRYPRKEVAALNEMAINHIMTITQCQIHINKTINDHKMVEITLEGTSSQIFNGHQEIRNIFDNCNRNRNRNNTPKKLINWNLDVSNSVMLNTVKDILNKNHSTNWAIFEFKESEIENLKCLTIEKYGSDIIDLSTYLSNIDDLKYCLLRFNYGFDYDIERHQIIFVIWSPSASSRNGQKKNIIPILRHKSVIKKILSATYEITVNGILNLTSSFILSELYRSNLVNEILLRVTKSSQLEYTKTDKFFASRRWTLRVLLIKLSKKYNINENDIQICHILYNVKKRLSQTKFNSRRQTEHIFNKADDLDKKLYELKLYHGSRIILSKNINGNNTNSLTNSLLAAQRRAQFTATKKMSKTNKIKIKLKLSTHIRNIRHKTLKSMRNNNNNNNNNNVSLRIAQYEAAHNKSHSVPIPPLSRQRSLSTTLTEGLSKNIMKNIVDQHLFDYEIFEPIIISPVPKTQKLTKPLPAIIKEEEKEEKEEKKEYIECTLDLNEVFIVEKSVGRGKTAHVHYAIYKQECDIALKEFRFGRLTDKIIFDFHKELETLKKLDNDNICRLLGHYYDFDSKQLYLAFEWCPCGCLYDIIHDITIDIEFIDVLQMSIDISKGMKYLHSQNIIHRDLKTHNLLLDENYNVKITDFGTAKTLDKIEGTAYTEIGTGGYVAPEVIEPPLEGYNSKIDIFSFGVVMWELYHRQNIFDQKCLRNISQLKQGIRPSINENCPIKYKQLIEKCWQFDPQKRPTFDSIVSILLQLYHSMVNK